MLTIHRAHPSKNTQHRLGKCSETHTNSKKAQKKTPTSMQRRAPKRRLGNTSYERWRWLSKPSVSTFAEIRNGWTEYPSSAQQTFRKHLKPKHQSQLAKSTSSKWRLFELEDEQSKDAHEQTSSQHDTTLETSLRWKPEYERPPPPTEMPRFARLPQFTPHRFELRSETSALCGMWRIIIHTRRKHEHHVFWKFDIPKLFRQNLSSRRQQMFTHGHTLWREHEARTLKWNTQQHDVLMMRSMNVGKAWWNETSNICGDAHAHKTAATPCIQQCTTKSKYNSCVTRNQSKQTRIRCNPRKNKHVQPSKNTPIREHSASDPESGVRMTQPFVLGETIWGTVFAQKPSRSDYIIDTQTKTRWHKNHFAKRWQTEPSHAQLVFHRDHTCIKDTTKRRTTNRWIPTASHWKQNTRNGRFQLTIHRTTLICDPWNPAQSRFSRTVWQRYHMKKQQCSHHNNPNTNDKKTVTIMTYRKYDVFTFRATLWHLADVHNQQTIKP